MAGWLGGLPTRCWCAELARDAVGRGMGSPSIPHSPLSGGRHERKSSVHGGYLIPPYEWPRHQKCRGKVQDVGVSILVSAREKTLYRILLPRKNGRVITGPIALCSLELYRGALFFILPWWFRYLLALRYERGSLVAHGTVGAGYTRGKRLVIQFNKNKHSSPQDLEDTLDVLIDTGSRYDRRQLGPAGLKAWEVRNHQPWNTKSNAREGPKKPEHDLRHYLRRTRQYIYESSS